MPGLIGIGAIAAAIMTSPAAAQCRLCKTPSTLREESASTQVQLELETRLDFDRLVIMDASGGSATLRPDGSRSVTGGLSDLSGRAMVGSAVVRGEPGRMVRVELPKSIELHSLSGGLISIDDLVSDLPTVSRLDSAGKLSFRFGGRLTVTGDAEGDYRGDLRITVDYL